MRFDLRGRDLQQPDKCAHGDAFAGANHICANSIAERIVTNCHTGSDPNAEYAREPADQHVPNVPQGRRRRRCIPRILGVTERPRHGRGAEQRRRLRHCH